MALIATNELIPHGKVTTENKDGVLKLTTQSSVTSIAYNLVGSSYKRHYLEFPQKARLPFALSMKLKLDYSGLILLVGEGHVLFNCPCSHAVEDPVKPSGKAQQFDNRLPLNSFVTVTIIFTMHEMQVAIDGKEAFYSNKLPYMKAKETAQQNENGFCIGVEAAKLSTLWIKDIELTDLPQDETVTRLEPYRSADEDTSDKTPEKPGFESFVSSFSREIQKEIVETDACLKSLKLLKMKRAADKSGDKLTYTSSDFGISYIIRRSCGEAWQSFSFYVVTSGKAETWHRKADYMEEALQEISKTDPKLAERIFFALNDCVGCYGSRCIVKTLYSFEGKKKLACHGVVMLRICPEDFADVRGFFRALNTMLERKTLEDSLQTEPIYMIKK